MGVRLFSLTLCSLLLVLGSSCTRAKPNANSADSATAPSAPGTSAASRALSVADIAERSTKAIVSVRSNNSLGTGFIVRDDGWIATNFHVAAVPEELWVLLSDGRRFPIVEVVNASRRHDLAILRIDAKQLPTLQLGDSDAVRPGDAVVAIGHPLGLEDTVSNGLVSAVRHVDKDFDVLQISAPIAPGSSGGPLFNDRGQVIGVAAAIMRGGQNLNFGLPVKYVKALAAHPQPVSISDFTAAIVALSPHMPRVERHVPHHPNSVLDGCDHDAIASIPKILGEAIEVGAPLYNQGNFEACFHIYEGAAMDLERRLPKRCAGPRRALGEGRARAAKLDQPSAQAWALRDAFDGLFEVVARHDDSPSDRSKSDKSNSDKSKSDRSKSEKSNSDKSK